MSKRPKTAYPRHKARQINVAEAKAKFSSLVRQALSGDDVVIAKDNKPLLRLVRLEEPQGSRQPGSAKGQVRMSPDFDATPVDFESYS